MLLPRHTDESDRSLMTAFVEHYNHYMRRWTGLNCAEQMETAVLVEELQAHSLNVPRAAALYVLAPLTAPAHYQYYSQHHHEDLLCLHKLLLMMRINDIVYNDYTLNRFCELYLRSVQNFETVLKLPMPDNSRDIEKMIWDFVVKYTRDGQIKQGWELLKDEYSTALEEGLKGMPVLRTD